MSKIVFLLMSCNNEFFQKEEELVKSTWLKPIVDGKYPDIDYYFYTAGEKSHIEGHKIYVESDDGWFATFHKTKLAFQALQDNNIEYDYIVRVNLSTYVNLGLLLMFIKLRLEYTKDQRVWGTELLMHKDTPYMIGKFLIFPKERVQETLSCDSKFDTQYDADDYVFGCMFNDVKKYKNFEPFYALPCNSTLNTWSHNVYDSNFDWESAGKHIALSFKSYNENYDIREALEFKACRMLHERLGELNPSIGDMATLMHYDIPVIIDIDKHLIKAYQSPCCIFIFEDENMGLESTRKRLEEVVDMYKNQYNIYLILHEGVSPTPYYDSTNNYPFRILTLGDVTIDYTLSNPHFWSRFVYKYEYACVIKSLNFDLNKDIIEEYINNGHDVVGSEQISVRKIKSMLDYTEYAYPVNSNEWDKLTCLIKS